MCQWCSDYVANGPIKPHASIYMTAYFILYMYRVWGQRTRCVGTQRVPAGRLHSTGSTGGAGLEGLSRLEGEPRSGIWDGLVCGKGDVSGGISDLACEREGRERDERRTERGRKSEGDRGGEQAARTLSLRCRS